MENEENIKLLKEIIQGERKKVAVFVGAGVSDPLGIKTWKKLLLEMANEFNCEIDIEECISKKGYPGTASEIYNHISNHEDYLRFLHIQFEPTKCNFTSLHLKIIDFFHTIFTTNFDSAFEKAFYDRERYFNTQSSPILILSLCLKDRRLYICMGIMMKINIFLEKKNMRSIIQV